MPARTSMSLRTPSRGSSISAHMWPATTFGRNHGSSSNTEREAESSLVAIEKERGRKPQREFAHDGPARPDDGVAQREPEHRVGRIAV